MPVPTRADAEVASPRAAASADALVAAAVVVASAPAAANVAAPVAPTARSEWRRVVDTASGRPYWYHRVTKETRWSDPDSPAVASAMSAPATLAAPAVLTVADALAPAPASPKAPPATHAAAKTDLVYAFPVALSKTSAAQRKPPISLEDLLTDQLEECKRAAEANGVPFTVPTAGGLLPLEFRGAGLEPASRAFQMRGEVWKKGRSGWREWAPRYMITHRWSVIYYDGAHAPVGAPSGVFDLRYLEELMRGPELPADALSRDSVSRNALFKLRLHGAGKIFLQAATEDDAVLWHDRILMACARFGCKARPGSNLWAKLRVVTAGEAGTVAGVSSSSAGAVTATVAAPSGALADAQTTEGSGALSAAPPDSLSAAPSSPPKAGTDDSASPRAAASPPKALKSPTRSPSRPAAATVETQKIEENATPSSSAAGARSALVPAARATRSSPVHDNQRPASPPLRRIPAPLQRAQAQLAYSLTASDATPSVTPRSPPAALESAPTFATNSSVDVPAPPRSHTHHHVSRVIPPHRRAGVAKALGIAPAPVVLSASHVDTAHLPFGVAHAELGTLKSPTPALPPSASSTRGLGILASVEAILNGTGSASSSAPPPPSPLPSPPLAMSPASPLPAPSDSIEVHIGATRDRLRRLAVAMDALDAADEGQAHPQLTAPSSSPSTSAAVLTDALAHSAHDYSAHDAAAAAATRAAAHAVHDAAAKEVARTAAARAEAHAAHDAAAKEVARTAAARAEAHAAHDAAVREAAAVAAKHSVSTKDSAASDSTPSVASSTAAPGLTDALAHAAHDYSAHDAAAAAATRAAAHAVHDAAAKEVARTAAARAEAHALHDSAAREAAAAAAKHAASLSANDAAVHDAAVEAVARASKNVEDAVSAHDKATAAVPLVSEGASASLSFPAASASALAAAVSLLGIFSSAPPPTSAAVSAANAQTATLSLRLHASYAAFLSGRGAADRPSGVGAESSAETDCALRLTVRALQTDAQLVVELSAAAATAGGGDSADEAAAFDAITHFVRFLRDTPLNQASVSPLCFVRVAAAAAVALCEEEATGGKGGVRCARLLLAALVSEAIGGWFDHSRDMRGVANGLPASLTDVVAEAVARRPPSPFAAAAGGGEDEGVGVVGSGGGASAEAQLVDLLRALRSDAALSCAPAEAAITILLVRAAAGAGAARELLLRHVLAPLLASRLLTEQAAWDEDDDESDGAAKPRAAPRALSVLLRLAALAQLPAPPPAVADAADALVASWAALAAGVLDFVPAVRAAVSAGAGGEVVGGAGGALLAALADGDDAGGSDGKNATLSDALLLAYTGPLPALYVRPAAAHAAVVLADEWPSALYPALAAGVAKNFQFDGSSEGGVGTSALRSAVSTLLSTDVAPAARGGRVLTLPPFDSSIAALPAGALAPVDASAIDAARDALVLFRTALDDTRLGDSQSLTSWIARGGDRADVPVGVTALAPRALAALVDAAQAVGAHARVLESVALEVRAHAHCVDWMTATVALLEKRQ